MLFKTPPITQLFTCRTSRKCSFLLFLTRNSKRKTRNSCLHETRNTKHETSVYSKPETATNTKHLRSSVALCGKEGFTLIEVIVSILIFGILSALLFSTFINIQRNVSEQRWKNQLLEEGVKICNIIRMELTGASKIHYADQDSILFVNQEGQLSSFCWKDSLLFKSNKKIIPLDTKVTSFKFIYYLPSEFIAESAEPVYYLPVNQISLDMLKVIDWKIELQKGKTKINLKTGVFIRSTIQR